MCWSRRRRKKLIQQINKFTKIYSGPSFYTVEEFSAAADKKLALMSRNCAYSVRKMCQSQKINIWAFPNSVAT